MLTCGRDAAPGMAVGHHSQVSETPGDDAANAPVPAPAASLATDDVFGTVLPDQTSDDRDSGDWRDDVGRDRDDDLREDVPPHY